MAERKKGLGRGLEALFEDNAHQLTGVQTLRISLIDANKNQPRRQFDSDALEELSKSIKAYGVLQPIVVRANGDRYQIVAGERRWRGAMMAQLTEIPALVLELADERAAEISLIENLQRENLNPVEEAMGYQALMDTFSLTQEQVAGRVNKSRSAVANALRLINLPSAVLKMLESGKITAGHAKVLAGLKDPRDVEAIAAQVASKKWTVRQLEAHIRKSAPESNKKAANKPAQKKTYYSEIELALKAELGRKVKITAGKKGGEITVPFYNDDELRDLANRIANIKD